MVDWLQINPNSGSGDTQVTITASTNEQLTERLYNLVVSGTTKSVNIPVTQGMGLGHNTILYVSDDNTKVELASALTNSYTNNYYSTYGLLTHNTDFNTIYSEGGVFYAYSLKFSDNTKIDRVKLPSSFISVSGDFAAPTKRFELGYGIYQISYYSPSLRNYRSPFNTSIQSLKLPRTLQYLFYRVPTSYNNYFADVFYQCNNLPESDGLRYTSLQPSDNPFIVTATNKTLSAYTIMEGTAGIQEYGLRGCTSLSSVKIPDSLYYIGDHAFTGTNITSNSVSGESYTISSYTYTPVFVYTSLNADDNPCLMSAYTKVNTGSIIYNMSSDRSMPELINGLRIIGPELFSPHYDGYRGGSSAVTGYNIKEFVMPDSVISVCRHAFASCSALTSVTFSKNLKYIGMGAFNGCSGLTSIDLPSSLEVLGHYAFGFSGLVDVVVPEGVKVVYDSFYGCNNMTKLTLPSTLKYTLGYGVGGSALTNIYCYAKEEPYVFYNYEFINENSNEITLHIPYGSKYNFTEKYSMLSVKDDADVDRYLRFDITSNGTIKWKKTSSSYNGRTISYKKNDGGWVDIISTTDGVSINVSGGDVLLFNGNNSTYCDVSSGYHYSTFSGSTAGFKVSGNILSLVSSSFATLTTLYSDCTFYGLFEGCTGLTDASSLILNASVLSERCYSHMFNNCTSLVKAPILRTKTLANYCYESMFRGCTSLTTSPELPANTLTSGCYDSMFYGCQLLTGITCYANDISASNCTNNWVYGVSGFGTFTKYDYMSDFTTGNSGIPSGWAVNDVIEGKNEYLTFEILNSGSLTMRATQSNYISINYQINDGGWTNVWVGSAGTTFNVSAGDNVYFKAQNTAYSTSSGAFSIICQADCNIRGNIMSLIDYNFENNETLVSSNTFEYLFSGSNVIDASKLVLPTNLKPNCFSALFQNCTKLTKTPVLRATTLANYCYSTMFKNCTSLTTAPELPVTTLQRGCYSGMFNGCTSLTDSPVLSATTLVDYCYSTMFSGCSSLSAVTCYATAKTATNCTANWLSNVSSTGIFTKASSTTWSYGSSGVPYNWTVVDAT